VPDAIAPEILAVHRLGPTVHREVDGQLEGAIAVLPVDGDRRIVGLQPRVGEFRGDGGHRRGEEVAQGLQLDRLTQAGDGVGRRRNGLDAHPTVAPSPIAFAA
jgi:hypothetical protein